MTSSDPARLILVVDDDDELRASISEALTMEGWEVAGVRTGGDGLVELVSGDNLPAALLLDLNTPGLDGRAFLKARAQNSRLAEIPVIVLTAARENLPVVENGTMLFKPFPMEELLQVVATHACNRPPPPPR